MTEIPELSESDPTAILSPYDSAKWRIDAALKN